MECSFIQPGTQIAQPCWIKTVGVLYSKAQHNRADLIITLQLGPIRSMGLINFWGTIPAMLDGSNCATHHHYGIGNQVKDRVLGLLALRRDQGDPSPTVYKPFHPFR